MKYVPLASRVIVEEVQQGKQARGLWVPDVARKNKGVSFGKVIGVGPGRYSTEGKLIPMHVKLDDVVMFASQAAAVIPVVCADGSEVDVLMLNESDIACIVHDLPRETGLIDIGGAPLSINPVSMALPDGAYKSREQLAESISDLKQSGAPPDVIADVQMADQTEGEIDAIEAP